MNSSWFAIALICVCSTFVTSDVCNNPIPIADYFQYGYDLSEFDIYGCPEFGGRREKLIDLSHCDTGKKFKLNDVNRTEFNVPDSIFSFYEAESTHSESSHVYTDIRDIIAARLKTHAFRSFSTRISGLELSEFRNSEFYHEMLPIYWNDSYAAISYYESASVGMNLNSHSITGSPQFQRAVQALPDTFVGNEQKYVEFVQKYGTHFISNGLFGGIVYRMTTVHNDDLGTSKGNDIISNMQKDVMALPNEVDIVCENVFSTRNVQKVFDRQRNFKQVMIGGFADYELFVNRTIPLAEMRAKPALISAELQPISDLVQDSDRRVNLVQAIRVHMAKAGVKAAMYSMEWLLDGGKRPEFPGTDIFRKRYEESKYHYNETEMQQLTRDINLHNFILYTEKPKQN